jgi:four helix bundle protein
MEDGAKPRDLKDRTFQFAEAVRAFVKQLPRTVSNSEDVRQLVRASGSVAANWIEADEALSKKRLFAACQNLPQGSKGEPTISATCRRWIE